MKYHRSLYALLLAASGIVTPALQADDGFAAQTYKPADANSINYRIHTPEGMDAKASYPLVLFLHGAGERGDDNSSQLLHGARAILAYSIKNNQPVIIVVPQCPPNQQWVDAPWGADSHTMSKDPAPPMRRVIELLNVTLAKLPVDKARVYVTGLSMGGFGTWDLIQRLPTRFAAAMPVCGGGDTQLAKAIKEVPIWAFHGGNDTIVMTQRSRAMIAALKEAGGKPSYTEYPGVDHNAWTQTYADDAVLKWLFDQLRH